MAEFDIGKLIKIVIVAFVLIFLLRACTSATVGDGHYGGGGPGFFSGLFLGQMLGGGGRGYDRDYRGSDKNVRRGSSGSGFGQRRSGGFGFGK